MSSSLDTDQVPNIVCKGAQQATKVIATCVEEIIKHFMQLSTSICLTDPLKKEIHQKS